MPFGRYFLVIGPSLAAFLWVVSSYMEPDPPVRAKSPTTAQAAGPGTTASGQAGKAVVPVQAATPAAAVRVEPAANPPAQGAPSQGMSETAAAETAASAEPAPPPVDAAQKHKKRKQVAQRRQRRNNYAWTARRYDTPYYNAPYYAYAPPYARYRPYPYGQR